MSLIVPTQLTRCALFSCGKPRPFNGDEWLRSLADDEEPPMTQLASASHLTVMRSGPELFQIDLDVLGALLSIQENRCRGTGATVTAFTTSLSEVGDYMGRGSNSANSLEARAGALARLCRVRIHFIDKSNNRSFEFALLPGKGEEEGRWYIEFHPKFLQMLETGKTFLAPKERQTLSKKGLAGWLHAWLQGQSADIEKQRYSVDWFFNLTGSKLPGDLRVINGKVRSKFKEKLKAALDEIVALNRPELLLEYKETGGNFQFFKKKLVAEAPPAQAAALVNAPVPDVCPATLPGEAEVIELATALPSDRAQPVADMACLAKLQAAISKATEPFFAPSAISVVLWADRTTRTAAVGMADVMGWSMTFKSKRTHLTPKTPVIAENFSDEASEAMAAEAEPEAHDDEPASPRMSFISPDEAVDINPMYDTPAAVPAAPKAPAQAPVSRPFNEREASLLKGLRGFVAAHAAGNEFVAQGLEYSEDQSAVIHENQNLRAEMSEVLGAGFGLFFERGQYYVAPAGTAEEAVAGYAEAMQRASKHKMPIEAIPLSGVVNQHLLDAIVAQYPHAHVSASRDPQAIEAYFPAFDKQ